MCELINGCRTQPAYLSWVQSYLNAWMVENYFYCTDAVQDKKRKVFFTLRRAIKMHEIFLEIEKSGIKNILIKLLFFPQKVRSTYFALISSDLPRII